MIIIIIIIRGRTRPNGTKSMFHLFEPPPLRTTHSWRILCIETSLLQTSSLSKTSSASLSTSSSSSSSNFDIHQDFHCKLNLLAHLSSAIGSHHHYHILFELLSIIIIVIIVKNTCLIITFLYLSLQAYDTAIGVLVSSSLSYYDDHHHRHTSQRAHVSSSYSDH